MTDKEYWESFNPKNWDKDTWYGGAMTVAMIVMLYFILIIFEG